MNPYLQKKLVSVSDWPEYTYLSKLVSDIFWLIDRGYNPRNGISNKPKRPSHTDCIYIAAVTQKWKIKKPKAECEFGIDTEYEQEKTVAALIL